MRAVVLSAILLSACISEEGADAPSSSSSSSSPGSSGGTTEAAAPSAASAAVSTGPKKIVGYFANWTQYQPGDCKFTTTRGGEQDPRSLC